MNIFAKSLLLLFLLLSTLNANPVFTRAFPSNEHITNAKAIKVSSKKDLGDLFVNLSNEKQLKDYKILFSAFLQVSSVGFFIATILKFKQYKDNPTQIPVSTPFAFLLVAVLSLTSYQIIKPVTKSTFGVDIKDPEDSCKGLPGSSNCD